MSARDTDAPAMPAAPPRRRRPGRPPTVPLAEFGKEPPPPPPIRLSPRQVAITLAVGIVVLLVLWFGAVQAGHIADERWSSAGRIDQRSNR